MTKESEKGGGPSHGKICGIVSSSYVGDSNNSFMRDIENVMVKMICPLQES
jgi:hypothetical protein